MSKKLGRPTTKDPQCKVNFRIRQSLQCWIEEKSYELNIPQSVVVDMILSSSIHTFEKVHSKQIEIEQQKRG